MATLSMPAVPGFAAGTTFGLRTSVRVFRSPYTGAVQVSPEDAEAWVAAYEVGPMTWAQAAPWRAFLAALRGPVGRFHGWDPMAREHLALAALTAGGPDASTTTTTADTTAWTADLVGRPANLGAPVVHGRGQTGSTLATRGWSWTATPVLLAGDYISVTAIHPVDLTAQRALHMVTADVTATAAGRADVPIVPPLRHSPADGATVETGEAASAVMLLSPDQPVEWSGDPGRFVALRFQAEQALSDLGAA